MRINKRIKLVFAIVFLLLPSSLFARELRKPSGPALIEKPRPAKSFTITLRMVRGKLTCHLTAIDEKSESPESRMIDCASAKSFMDYRELNTPLEGNEGEVEYSVSYGKENSRPN